MQQRPSVLFTSALLALAIAQANADESKIEDAAKKDTVVASKLESKDKGKTKDSDASQDAEEVMVTGIRFSMERAQDIKRTSDSILDAVVAEDIGKLPDATAAESLARIVGVQVTRFNDEADSILIRGLPDVTTTYNGREFFTAELRRSQLQDFPAQALSGIEVYKSATADLIEPGLAGLVNVRTRRPFDFDGQKVAFGYHLGYNDQSEENSQSGNALYSNRWDTSAGEMGFLANVTYAETKYYNGARYNSTAFPQAQVWHHIEAPYSAGGFVLPATVGFYNSSGDRERPSGNASFQWAPSDNVEIFADFIYQGYRAESQADNLWFPTLDFDWLNGTGDVTLTDIEMVEGSNGLQAASLTKSGGLPAQMFRSTHQEKTDTYQYAIGVKWNTDRLKIVTDLAYTDSKHSNTEFSFDTGLSFSPTVKMDFFGDIGATFTPTNWDPTNLSTYEVRGYWESKYDVGGKGWQWRTDLTYDTGWDVLQEIKGGIRYSTRDATRDSGNRYAWLWNLHIPFSQVSFLEYEQTFDPIRTDAQTFTQWMQPTFKSIQANREQLVTWAHDNALKSWDAWRAPAWENLEIPSDPATQWRAEEDVYSAYLQAKSHFDIDSIGIDVFAGARISQTDADYFGTSTVTKEGVKTLEPRHRNNNYVDVLPNISARIALTDKMQLRAGFTKTRTKPSFNDMNPALNITQIVSGGVIDPNAPPQTYDADGWGGNPDLKPLTSKNYDLSLEYYFTKTSFVSAAAFYKDLWGFTSWYTRLVETSDYGTVRLNRPENAGEGRLKGWELNASTFFDFEFVPDALRSLGGSFNVTKLDGKNRLPNADGTFGDFSDIPGLSRYTYNATLFYERDKIGARLSYNLREKWVNWYGQGVASEDFSGNKTEARDRLDLSVRYTFNPTVDLYIDFANILATPFKNYTVNPQGYKYYQDIRDEGRYLGGGLSVHF